VHARSSVREPGLQRGGPWPTRLLHPGAGTDRVDTDRVDTDRVDTDRVVQSGARVGHRDAGGISHDSTGSSDNDDDDGHVWTGRRWFDGA